MKTFYNVVSSLLLKQTVCFAKEARASIVLIIEWVQFVLQSKEKLHSVQGMQAYYKNTTS